jgi:hypothetical protein
MNSTQLVRELIKTLLKRIVKDKRFWVTVILIFIAAVLFDLIMLPIVVYQRFTGVPWNLYLIATALGSVFLSALSKQITAKRKELNKISQLLWIVAVIWAWKDHGFLDALLMVTAMFVATRVLKLFLKIIKTRISRVERLERIS